MSVFPKGMWTNLTPYDCLQVFLDETDSKFCQSIQNAMNNCLFKPQYNYSLAAPYGMVHLFVPPRGARQLCVPLAARYGLAEQVYHTDMNTTNCGFGRG